jgi:acetolactate synthase small subunit
MNEINQIKSLVADFCKEGYIDNKDKEMLLNLAKRYAVKEKEVEKLIQSELALVKTSQVEKLFKILDQPDAAVREKMEFNPQSKRFFPDLLNIGNLDMTKFKNDDAYALIPLTEMAGVCLFQSGNNHIASSMLQNMAVRLALSIPQKKTRFTLVDIEQSGLAFSHLSGLDERIYTIVDSVKQFEAIIENLVKESSSFIFKEIGNKYKSYNEYFTKNKNTASPYHIFLINGLGGKIPEEMPGNLTRLIKLAPKAGIFFLLNLEHSLLQSLLKQEPELKEAVENNMFVYDLNDKSYKSNNQDIDLWYNKIYNISHRSKIEFENYHLALINHEFDPVAHKKPETKIQITDIQSDGKDSIQNVLLPLGTSNTDELLEIIIDDNREDALVLSSEAKAKDAIFKHTLSLLASHYSSAEVDIKCFGLNGANLKIAELLPHCTNIITGNNPVYLEGLIENLNVEIQRRKDLFNNAPVKVNNYTDYRKLSEEILPRQFVLIQGLDEIIANASDLFSIEIIEKLSNSLNDCNGYGIHFIIFSEPNETILSLDLNQFEYKLFYKSDTEKSKDFANLSNADGENLKKADKVVLYSQSDNNINICTIKLQDDKSLMEQINHIAENTYPASQEKFILNTLETSNILHIPDNLNPVSVDGAINLYIGESQWYTSDKHYILSLPKSQSPNVMICGNDKKVCPSLLLSMQNQLGNVCDITVLDFEKQMQNTKASTDKCNVIDSASQLSKFVDELKDKTENIKNNPGILSPKHEPHLILVLNTDKLMKHDEQIDIFANLSHLLQNTKEHNIRLIMQINDEGIFGDDYLTLFSKFTFGTSIICKGANENLLSATTIMDNKIGIPKEESSVIIETEHKKSAYIADPVKLYQIM